jgi:hypothetical protein
MSAFYEAARLLIKHVKLSDMKWRQHGLGMLQAEITDALRVHIWHPRLRTMVVSNFHPGSSFREVHDHRFDLTSAVILGEIIDVPFFYQGDGRASSLESEDNGEWGWRRTKCWEILHAKIQIKQGTTGDAPAATDYKFISDVSVALAQAKENWPRYKAGAEYKILRRHFHTTRIDDLAVTVVHRANFDVRSARVLGSEKEAAKSGIIIDDNINTKVLWAWVIREAEQALALLDR